MKTFTGVEYLKIDIANCFGLDRLNWMDRLYWVDTNNHQLKDLACNAKHPVLYRKGLRALRIVEKGLPTNHIMGLDATASGIQLMAAISGCHTTAATCNLINTGQREDVYASVATHMNQVSGLSFTRNDIKQPLMTVVYGSTEQPKQIFGEGEELIVFYDTIKERIPGAWKLLQLFMKYWDSYAEYHSWTLPDGHVAKVPVVEVMEKKLEIDEEDHMRFTYRASVVTSKRKSRSLPANIIHSIDGWVVRQMVQAANKQGFWMAPVHDCSIRAV